MKKISVLIIVILFIIHPSATGKMNSNFFENDTDYYALIVGCMIFKNESWNIASENRTVDSYQRFLYDPLVQSANWHEDNIVFLTDDHADRQSVLDALLSLSLRVDENDVFLFSWHSHGNQVPDLDGDEAFFNQDDRFDETIAPYDIDVVNNSLVNYISDDDLRLYLDMFYCEAIIVNIEACFSGGFAEDLTKTLENEEIPGRVIFLSTPNNHLEWVHPWDAWGWMSSLGMVISSPLTDRNNDLWISVDEAYHLAAPLYYCRSYIWIHGIPFLGGMLGSHIMFQLIDVLTIRREFFDNHFLLSVLIGLGIVRIIEHHSEKETGHPSANHALYVDTVDGDLLFIYLG